MTQRLPVTLPMVRVILVDPKGNARPVYRMADPQPQQQDNREDTKP